MMVAILGRALRLFGVVSYLSVAPAVADAAEGPTLLRCAVLSGETYVLRIEPPSFSVPSFVPHFAAQYLPTLSVRLVNTVPPIALKVITFNADRIVAESSTRLPAWTPETLRMIFSIDRNTGDIRVAFTDTERQTREGTRFAIHTAPQQHGNCARSAPLL